MPLVELAVDGAMIIFLWLIVVRLSEIIEIMRMRDRKPGPWGLGS